MDFISPPPEAETVGAIPLEQMLLPGIAAGLLAMFFLAAALRGIAVARARITRSLPRKHWKPRKKNSFKAPEGSRATGIPLRIVAPEPVHLARPEAARPNTSRPDASPAVPPNDHLALVARASYRLVPLLNRSEARVLPMLERIVAEIDQGHRVMAQVSMGEILRAVDTAGRDDFDSAANRAINAKRLDFVIINRGGIVVAALEYQGSGHHLSDTAFLRDAVKREALRKAGLSLIELPADTSEAHLRSRLSAQTKLPVALSPKQRDSA